MDSTDTPHILWPLLWVSVALLLASLAANAGLFHHLRRYRARLDHSEAATRSAMAYLSHEIRNPLAGVLSAVRLLRRTGLSPDQRRLVDTLDDSGQCLLALLEQTLSESSPPQRLATVSPLTPRPPETVTFSPGSLLNELLALFEAQAVEKGLLFFTDLEPGVPCRLRGDVARLRQILVNLLGNAIKFTPHGIVKLQARVAGGRGGQVVLAFAVIDTGMGIPATALPTLFEPHWQAPGVRLRFGGEGLGLHISQRLANQMGGTLQVVSEEGLGSTFTLSVPLQDAIPDTAAVVYPMDMSHRAKRASGLH